jgi:endonuclease I
MKKTFLSFPILLLLSISIFAQIPAGYYDSAIGKKQAELKTALHLKIKVANVPSYGSGSGSTWAAFAKTDVRPEDGTVWDMYSNNHVKFNGTSAASGMNIEHSFAKSWWGGGRQAASDVGHLKPSNSTANSAKGSWPMAVVDGATTFSNGSIKVGKSTSKPGTTIDAWEPADEYKGDFSRAYMYMVTAYEDYATIWTGNSINQLDNNTYPVFEQWTVDLLLKWSRQDPISQKEITHNNELYKIQNNRNPYIDYPLMAEYVWGNLMTVPFTPTGNVDYPYISTPTNGAIVDFGKVVYQQIATTTINLKALNLSSDLTLTLSGTNAGNFSVLNTTITKSEAEAGTILKIEYSAQTVGTHTAQITISGGGISPTTINLKAISSDDFLALAANNISLNSFMANWTVSAAATGYELNVFSLKSSGATTTRILVEEEFTNGLSSGWTSEGYTDNQTNDYLRLASAKSAGKIITPALDLSSSGITLTVRAKQYTGDTGAQLTASLDNEPLTVWTTSATNQDFIVNIPMGGSSSTIELSAETSSRVYVDYVKVATQGAVKTPFPVIGYPKMVGNVLNYNVSDLASDSVYYYTVTPQGNGVLVSNQITVRTAINTDINEQYQNNLVSWCVLQNGIQLNNLPENCNLTVYDVLGKQLQTINSNASEMSIKLPNKGIYLLKINSKDGIKVLKIRF